MGVKLRAALLTLVILIAAGVGESQATVTAVGLTLSESSSSAAVSGSTLYYAPSSSGSFTVTATASSSTTITCHLRLHQNFSHSILPNCRWERACLPFSFLHSCSDKREGHELLFKIYWLVVCILGLDVFFRRKKRLFSLLKKNTV